MMASRRGMALVAIMTVVSLVAILTVATLSVTTRLDQGSSLAVRDARLDAAASYALTTTLVQWRGASFSTIGNGASRQLGIPIAGSSIAASVTVTRLNSELFWVVAEATDVDQARRSESMLLRLAAPRADSIPALIAGGDAILTHQIVIVRDTQPQCNLSVSDLMIGPHASLTSPDGALPPLSITRSQAATDSAYQVGLDVFDVTALATSADVVLPAGAVSTTPNGVVHGVGDLTLTGGAGQGILVVDGRLNIAGPIDFAGLIVARAGVQTTAAGAAVTGSIRTGPAIGGVAPTMSIVNPFTIHPSACVVQAVLAAALIPQRIARRPWAEIY